VILEDLYLILSKSEIGSAIKLSFGSRNLDGESQGQRAQKALINAIHNLVEFLMVGLFLIGTDQKLKEHGQLGQLFN
jgi:hypothetical protein